MKQIGELLEALITNKKEVVVGKVDLVLAQKIRAIADEDKANKIKLTEKVKAYIQELEVAHEPIIDAMQLELNAAWEAIYDAAGIPNDEREKNYSINQKTGEVTRIDKEIDQRLVDAFSKSKN